MVDAPEKIYAKTHGASTDVIYGKQGLIGGWRECARKNHIEYVRADLHAELKAENDRLKARTTSPFGGHTFPISTHVSEISHSSISETPHVSDIASQPNPAQSETQQSLSGGIDGQKPAAPEGRQEAVAWQPTLVEELAERHKRQMIDTEREAFQAAQAGDKARQSIASTESERHRAVYHSMCMVLDDYRKAEPSIPRASNCARYLAEVNDGRLLYLNHANTWQECPNFLTRPAEQSVTDEMARRAYEYLRHRLTYHPALEQVRGALTAALAQKEAEG